ncbi:colicin D domain-containing protein [Pseudomonas guariconensis]
MTQIQGGLAALGTLQCTTPTCENIKFELLDRSFKALDSLDEVYGFGAIVIGGIAGMAGAGGSRPGAGAVPGASSNVNKAYEYWVAVKAERVAGAKATGNGRGFAGEITSVTQRQLDKKFKHASDFGVVTTRKNPETLAQFESAIKTHMGSTDTVQQGTYGFVKDSKVFFNSSTNNVVVVDAVGNFVTGFKLAPGTQQFENFIKNGVLR